MELSVSCHNEGFLRLLLLLSFSSLTVARPTYKQKHALFHNTHTLKDVIFTRNLLQVTRSSRVGCASNCHISRICQSYFYNKAAHKCRTHSDTFTVDDPEAIQEPGWEYYGIRRSSVRKKQARERANQLRTAITTTAPGMGGGLKFAQNATTTPMPDDVNEDDVTDEEYDDDDLLTTLDTSEQSTAGQRRTQTTYAALGKSKTATSDVRSSTFIEKARKTTEPSTAGKPQSSSPTDSDGVTTRTTETGSKVTIRKTTRGFRTSSTPVSKSDDHTAKTTDTQNPTVFSVELSTAKDGQNLETETSSTVPAIKEQTDNSVSDIQEPTENTNLGSHKAHPSKPHDEDSHDHLSFLTTQEQSDIFEMSTGLVIPGMTVSDEDEDDETAGAVTIVVMVEDEDEDESDQTPSFAMDTTMDVISINKHQHLHEDNDDDDDDGFFANFPISTGLLGFTLQSEAKNGKMAEGKSHVVKDVPYAVAKEKEAAGRAKSRTTKSVPTTASSPATPKVAALVTLGLVLPVLGIGAYAIYRKRKTGSWTLLNRQDDGLGLQLIKTT